MEKSCKGCGEVYWARWRNEPVELCPDCRIGVQVCERCAALDVPLNDPTQLVLFPLPPRRSRLESPDETEKYYSLRAQATRAERLANPFH